MKLRPFSPGLVLVLSALGCFQGIPEDIPCNSDETCPTGYYCGSLGECRDLEESSPPEIVVLGVSRSSSGEIEQEVRLPTAIRPPFYLWLGNDGGSEAFIPEIKLTAPECYGLPETLTARARVSPGEEKEESISYNPTPPCDPATVDVELRAVVGPSDRQFERVWTGSFRISLEP